MKAEVKDEGEWLLAGFVFYGDPFRSSGAWTEENEIGRLWKRFEGFLSESGEETPPFLNMDHAYEAHIWDQQTTETGFYEVFVGCRVANLSGIPVNLSVKLIPPTRYAVFTLSGSLIKEDWTGRMSREWLPENGLIQTANFAINVYDKRFKGMDRLDESELDVYVPVL
jgi:AraC family transcriptional regulator